MNITRKSPQKSSIPLKNPYDATGLSDRTPNNQNKSAISTIAGDFGKISQNSLNFVARLLNSTAQKSNTHQKNHSD